MTQFQDLDEFFDDTLPLPVGGKWYRIPAPDAEVGLLCQRLMHASMAAEQGETVDDPKLNELAEVVLSDDEERDLYQRILGPVWHELRTDGVSWPKVQHVGATALVWVAAGKEAAAKIWASGGVGKPRPRTGRLVGRRQRRRHRPDLGAPRLLRPGRRPLGLARPHRLVARHPDPLGARRARPARGVRHRRRRARRAAHPLVEVAADARAWAADV
ncbi:hypothetical protein ACFQQB_51295 [Nonomuraea rubra]|uniref:DUF7426 family protein n=1 Tax=Nonomuraea rubra TaxID=46180 RepID=UPI003621EB87